MSCLVDELDEVVEVNEIDDMRIRNPYASPKSYHEEVRTRLSIFEMIVYPGGLVISDIKHHRHVSTLEWGRKYNELMKNYLPECILMETIKLVLEGFIIAGGWLLF